MAPPGWPCAAEGKRCSARIETSLPRRGPRRPRCPVVCSQSQGTHPAAAWVHRSPSSAKAKVVYNAQRSTAHLGEEPNENVSRKTCTVFCIYIYYYTIPKLRPSSSKRVHTHGTENRVGLRHSTAPTNHKITGGTPGVGVRVGPSLAAGSGPGSVVAWSIHSLRRVELKIRFRRTPVASQHTGRHRRRRRSSGTS